MPRKTKLVQLKLTDPRGTMTKAKVRNMVKRAVNRGTETKYHKTTISLALVDDGGIIYDLTNIAVGDTRQTRDGHVISPYKFLLRGQYTWNSASTVAIYMRVLLVKTLTDQVPAFQDIFDTTDIAYPTTQYDATYFEDKKVRVVSDRTYMLDAQHPQVHVNEQFKLKGKCTYNGNASADTGKNHYFLMFVTNAQSGDASKPVIRWNGRLLFKDN